MKNDTSYILNNINTDSSKSSLSQASDHALLNLIVYKNNKNILNIIIKNIYLLKVFIFIKINDVVIYLKNKNKMIVESAMSQNIYLNDNFSNYENLVRRKFPEGLCTVALSKDENDHSKEMDFGVKVFDLMVDKLHESQLIENVDCLTIVSCFKKNEIKHIVEFELKRAGHDWSLVFSKFISSKIKNKVAAFEGKTNGQHFYNATQLRDYFIFSFSYQEVEIKDEVRNANNITANVFQVTNHENIHGL